MRVSSTSLRWPLVVLTAVLAHAQSADLVDPTFQPALSVTPDSVVPLADGRLYVTSYRENFAVAGRTQHGLARLLVDGSVDPSFNVGSGTDADGVIDQLDVLPDGRVVLTGSFTAINGVARPRLARLLPNGALDSTFSPDAALLAPSNLLLRAPLPDGRWIIATLANKALAFARFTAEGRPDPSYQSETIDLSDRRGNFSSSSSFAGFAASSRDVDGRQYFSVTFGSPFDATTREFYRLDPNGVLESRQLFSLGTSSPQIIGSSFSSYILGFDTQRALYQSSSSSFGKAGGDHSDGFGIIDLATGRRFGPPGHYWGFVIGGPPAIGYGFGPPATLASDGIYANAAGGRGRIGIVRLDFAGNFDPDFSCELTEPNFLFGFPAPSGAPNYQILANGQILLRATSVNRTPVRFLARLTPNRRAGATRLGNVSVRARAGPATQPLVLGYVVTNGRRNMLARAAGPALAPFGVAGALSDPVLTLARNGVGLASNDDWTPSTAAAGAAVGAFAFPAGSRDGALAMDHTPGAYTVAVSSKDGSSGTALVELYDLDPRPAGASGARLANFSARAVAGSAADPLIAGFTIDGDSPRKVLIRAIGPSLGKFGVTSVLTDPVLTVYRRDTVIATNDNWSSGLGTNPYWNDPAFLLREVFGSAGAFPLDFGTKDAALSVTLAPGNYTAQVTSADGTSGVVLLEVYDVL